MKVDYELIPNTQKVFAVSTIVLNEGKEVHWALRPVLAWIPENDVNGEPILTPVLGGIPPANGTYVEAYCLGHALVNANGTIHDGETHWIGIEHYLMSCTGRTDPIDIAFIPNISQSRFLELIK